MHQTICKAACREAGTACAADEDAVCLDAGFRQHMYLLLADLCAVSVQLLNDRFEIFAVHKDAPFLMQLFIQCLCRSDRVCCVVDAAADNNDVSARLHVILDRVNIDAACD